MARASGGNSARSSATIRLVNDAPREVRESALPPLTDNTTGAGEK